MFSSKTGGGIKPRRNKLTQVYLEEGHENGYGGGVQRNCNNTELNN